MINKQLVAVYGTLKRGQSNHHLMTRYNANFQGTTRLNAWMMLNLGAFPGIIPSESNQDWITVEVYEVNHLLLTALDHLEGVSGNFYERVEVQTSFGRAWIYMLHPQTVVRLLDKAELPEVCALGMWSPACKWVEYTHNAVHNAMDTFYQRRVEDLYVEEAVGGEVTEEELAVLEIPGEDDGAEEPVPAPRDPYTEVDYPSYAQGEAHVAVSDPAI